MRLTAVGCSGFSKATRPPPVNVCFVIDVLRRAGTEGQLLALLRHLDRSRVRPTLVLLREAEADTAAELPPDCPVLSLNVGKLATWRAAPAAARLARFWRRHRTAIVQTYFLDSTYFAAPLARLCGIRQVVRVRNNTGYWLTPTHRHLGRLIGRLCPLTLTNSEDGRRALAAHERLPVERIRVIENGVDLDRFAPGPALDTGRSEVRIGAVANLRPVKNIDGLVRVAAEVCRADPRVSFEVAGDGPQRSDLERRIRDLGLGHRFRLRGSVVDVPAFLATLDVAVLPSHSESMSNALLEYLAAGRAIVATDVGSNSRVIRSGREGLIVPPRDDGALSGAILRYLGSPVLARDHGQAARRRAQEFSRAASVRRFEEFYLSLVKP